MNKKIISIGTISMFLVLSIFSSINAVAVDPEDIDIEIKGMFRNFRLFGVRIDKGLSVTIFNRGDEDMKSYLDVKVLDSEGNDLVYTMPGTGPIFPMSCRIGANLQFTVDFGVNKGFGSVTVVVTLKDNAGSVIKEVTEKGTLLWRFLLI